MNLLEYKQQRQNQLQQSPTHREFCTVCRQPAFGCYCSEVQKFDPHISFVILIHPIEVKRRIATGRMSYLCLQNSHLIAGQNFTHNSTVNALLSDCNYQSVILYPGVKSLNLSLLTNEQRETKYQGTKPLRIFVLDGTWATAKKMLAQSQNLMQLPRICFAPDKPSNFRVRKQPHANCFSTIEAIHQIIDMIGPTQGFDVESREHDKLLHVFDAMVERQLSFISKARLNPDFLTYRRENRS